MLKMHDRRTRLVPDGLLALGGICAITIAPLALLPWLKVYTFEQFPVGNERRFPLTADTSVGGTDVSGLIDRGDGEAVALFAAAAALIATLSFALRRGRRLAAGIMALAGGAVVAITGYDATHDWKPEYELEFPIHFNVYDVNILPALWGTLGLGLVLCVVGLALFALAVMDRGTRPHQVPDAAQA